MVGAVVGVRAEAQVVWEGGVLVSWMLEFGQVWGSGEMGILRKEVLGSVELYQVDGGCFQGDFGREMEDCDAGSLVEIGG